MLKPPSLMFLFDVDNTLLDNDRFAADLRDHLAGTFGAVECERYWSIYARLRDERGYADYLGTLQEFRAGLDADPGLLGMSAFLLEYPFAQRLYPGALAAIAHARALGQVAILSDGDVVFQPRKIQRSGLWDAFDGHAMVYLHKERMLDVVRQCFPAEHYVMVDDKPKILAAMKRSMGGRLTTVFVRQGHYAVESARETIAPPPDVVIERIGELVNLPIIDLVAAYAPTTSESA